VKPCTRKELDVHVDEKKKIYGDLIVVEEDDEEENGEHD